MSEIHGSDVVTKLHREDDKFVFTRTQDCEAIIEANKVLANDPIKRDWGRHVATVPMVILEKWIVEDGVNYMTLPKDEFARLVKRKLRDPDWRFLRVTNGGNI